MTATRTRTTTRTERAPDVRSADLSPDATRAPAPLARALLAERVPGAAALRRAALGRVVSPVERIVVGEAALWVKRDDLNAPPPAGNKLRALEFLLGGVGAGDTVVTLGGDGSTHVLATATHAARLGARTIAVRWPHAMNPYAHRVAAEAARRCASVLRAATPVDGVARAWWVARRTGGTLVPVGGATPLGALGHVEAALELAAQVRAGLLPAPARLVVPVGSGGTAAGLLAGLALTDLPTTIVGARVVPHVATPRRRVLRLARAAHALLASLAGQPLPAPDASRFALAHEAYGGAYGRASPLTRAAAARTDAHLVVDDTYSGKALAVALALAERGDGETLFWMTFDARAIP